HSESGTISRQFRIETFLGVQVNQREIFGAKGSGCNLNLVEQPQEPQTGFIKKIRCLAERGRFELPVGYKPTHAFQACALNHSAISPQLSHPSPLGQGVRYQALIWATLLPGAMLFPGPLARTCASDIFLGILLWCLTYE